MAGDQRPLRARFGREAARDVELATEASYDLFGPSQAISYGELIDRAVDLIAADPGRPGSSDRSDLGVGVRSFPIGRASRRRASAAHTLFYLVAPAEHGPELVILRVLHHSMDPLSRVPSALASGPRGRRPSDRSR